MAGIRKYIKSKLVPAGVKPRKIHGGTFSGIVLNMDLANKTQHWLGLHERETYRWMMKFCRDIRSFADVGTSYGLYTLFALCRTPAARVLGFEPLTELHAELAENLALNNLSMRDPRFVLRTDLVGAETVGDFITLDSFAAELPAPCCVKIDIDGGEVEVLKGAGALIRRPDTRWMIETHSPELEDGCLAILREAGLEVKVIKNAWWRILVPEERPIAHNRYMIAYHK